MPHPDSHRHIEIKDGDKTVAGAEVTTSAESAGTARASLHAAGGHIAPGRRAGLVDAVMDLPQVQESERLEAASPLGDSESLERLRERTEDSTTRPAGSTALLDGKIPARPERAAEPEPTEPEAAGTDRGRNTGTACCPSRWRVANKGLQDHISGLTAMAVPVRGRQSACRTISASWWQRESMWPWRRDDSACASRPRAQPIRTRVRPCWPGFGHCRTAVGSASARAGRPVAGWTVGTALLAPVVLVGGWLVAGTLQPESYSPVRQTMSVLAGQSGTDRWVMTAALLLVGGCQIATGAGLTGVGWPARILLIVTGVSTLGVAASPEPATGPTPLPPCLRGELRGHNSGVARTGGAARHPIVDPQRLRLRTVTLLFAGLSGWLLIAAQDGSGDLGLLERLTSGLQGLFPLVVALAVRQAAGRQAASDGRAHQRLQTPARAQSGSVAGNRW